MVLVKMKGRIVLNPAKINTAAYQSSRTEGKEQNYVFIVLRKHKVTF